MKIRYPELFALGVTSNPTPQDLSSKLPSPLSSPPPPGAHIRTCTSPSLLPYFQHPHDQADNCILLSFLLPATVVEFEVAGMRWIAPVAACRHFLVVGRLADETRRSTVVIVVENPTVMEAELRSALS